MNQKIAILAVLASVLLSATILATPSLNVANAQGNQTGGGMNQTMHGNQPYYIEYMANEKDYQKYLPQFEQIVKSFKFTK